MHKLPIVVVRYLNEGWAYAEAISRCTQNYDLISVENTAVNAPLSSILNDWLKRVDGPYICIMSPDVIVAPGWDEACLNAIRRPEVAMAGPRMSGFAFPKQYTKLEGTPHDPFMVRLDHTAKLMIRDKGKVTESPIQGSCMFLDREAVLSAGGFDENLPFYGSDKDLYLTVTRKLKKRSVVALSGLVYHVGGVSIKRAVQKGVFKHDEAFSGMVKYFSGKWEVKDIPDTSVIIDPVPPTDAVLA